MPKYIKMEFVQRRQGPMEVIPNFYIFSTPLLEVGSYLTFALCIIYREVTLAIMQSEMK